MSKIIKRSELDKKIKKAIHLPIKNIDTIIFDECDGYSTHILEEKKYLINFDNILIDKELINNKYNQIRIRDTNAKNIYVEGYDNLGNLTIPYNIIKNDIDIHITFNKDNKINKINVLNNKNSTINLNDIPLSIKINEDNEKMHIYVEYNKEKIEYIIDNLGNIKIYNTTYIIDDTDIKDNTLDLTKYNKYDNIKFPDKLIDTVIINKHYIENPRKLLELSDEKIYITFHNYFRFNNLKIIEDNNMKLVPVNKIFTKKGNKKIYFISEKDTKYIYIKDKEQNNNILIYVDKNNEIKVIERKELLNNKDIEDAVINYDYNIIAHYKSPKLILIKYKDYYIVKDFDKEYIIDDLFFKLLSINISKYFYINNLIKMFLNKDLISIFNSGELSKDLFYEMYNDYLEYKNYIDKLNKIGFTNNAIEYLFDRKFNTIIDPKNNMLNDIDNVEIKHYNEIGNEYIKKKRLKNNTKDKM